jgi:hypothetical protein
MGGAEAYQKKTQPQSCRMGARAQAEVSDTADQDIRDDEVENAPRYVDVRALFNARQSLRPKAAPKHGGAR